MSRQRTLLACLSSAASLVACLGVAWTESLAYARLPDVRLNQLVGTKGECCMPGLRTNCAFRGSLRLYRCWN